MEIKVFPNPCSRILNVMIDENIKERSIIILYNLTGEPVLKQTLSKGKNVLYMDTMPAGTYIAKIQLANKYKYYKVLIAK